MLEPIDTQIKEAEATLRGIAASLEKLDVGQTPGDFPLFLAVKQALAKSPTPPEQLCRMIDVKPDAEKDDPAWRKFPVFREFFVQWRAARGTAEPGTYKKVFSHDWEELLRDAGLLSAVARKEAIRDVRVLESVGSLKLKTPTQDRRRFSG